MFSWLSHKQGLCGHHAPLQDSFGHPVKGIHFKRSVASCKLLAHGNPLENDSLSPSFYAFNDMHMPDNGTWFLNSCLAF